MIETLNDSNSPDLLTEFLNQGSDAPTTEETKGAITEIEQNNPKGVETIESNNNPGLDISTDLPEGFGEGEETTEEEDEDSTETTSSTEVAEQVETGEYSFKALANFLSEEGIVDFEDSEGLADTPEVLIESVKGTIKKEIEAYKESIPDRAKQIIEYLEKGGSLDTYLEAMYKPFDVTKLDLTSEGDQERVVREYLALQEYTQEEINETIADYKDSMILEKQSKVAAKQIQKYDSKREEEVVKRQELEQASRQEQYQTYVSNINTAIDSADKLAGLAITAKEKAEFKKYLLATDKEGFTQYARDVAENPIQTQIELAYLKFMKYDYSKAIKQGETAATKRIKDIFKRNETTIKTGKSIEEVADEKSNLEAFSMFRPKR